MCLGSVRGVNSYTGGEGLTGVVVICGGTRVKHGRWREKCVILCNYLIIVSLTVTDCFVYYGEGVNELLVFFPMQPAIPSVCICH